MSSEVFKDESEESETHIYSDINQYHPEDKNLLVDLESVLSSMETILATVQGERLFRPTFGANLEQYLFEPMDRVTSFNLMTSVLEALNKWDPRIILDTGLSEVVPEPDTHEYRLNLVFSISGISDRNFKFEGTIS